jgi:hypothetical protein
MVCKDKCPDELVEHLDEIYGAIEEEYSSADHIEESNAELEVGEEPDSTDWPVFDYDCGTSWFTIDHERFKPTAAPPEGTESE